MSGQSTLHLELGYRLKQLELYNWGGFDGYHSADIDPAGTAIVGPTGSGKTTLVDALMTLLGTNPKYNLASTGGHESDRDLVSYVRGVAGAGDGSGGQSHIARPGKQSAASVRRWPAAMVKCGWLPFLALMAAVQQLQIYKKSGYLLQESSKTYNNGSLYIARVVYERCVSGLKTVRGCGCTPTTSVII